MAPRRTPSTCSLINLSRHEETSIWLSNGFYRPARNAELCRIVGENVTVKRKETTRTRSDYVFFKLRLKFDLTDSTNSWVVSFPHYCVVCFWIHNKNLWGKIGRELCRAGLQHRKPVSRWYMGDPWAHWYGSEWLLDRIHPLILLLDQSGYPNTVFIRLVIYSKP